MRAIIASAVFAVLLATSFTVPAMSAERKSPFIVPPADVGVLDNTVETYINSKLHPNSITCQGRCDNGAWNTWQCADGERCGINCVEHYGYCY